MQYQHAFTLLEMLIALTILIIVTAFTFPAAQHLLQRGQDESSRMALIREINFAREQADLLHQTIIICQTRDAVSCSGTWSEGQLVFVDEAQDGVIHHAEQILMKHLRTVSQGNLHARFYPHYRDFIQFEPSTAEMVDNGTWWYCHASAKYPAWAVTVSRMGRVQTHLPNSKGEIYDSHQMLLTC